MTNREEEVKLLLFLVCCNFLLIISDKWLKMEKPSVNIKNMVKYSSRKRGGNMKLLKVLLALLTTISIVTMLGGMAHAHNTHPTAGTCTSGTTTTLDNDHGAINSSYNNYSGAWWYESGSTKAPNSYNGDHRYIVAPTPSISHYEWKLTDCGSLYGTMSVYIWHSKFYNSNVNYRNYYWGTNSDGSYSPTLVMNTYLDQETAKGGWNTIGKSSQRKTGHLELYVFTTSSSGVGGIGADAARVYKSSN